MRGAIDASLFALDALGNSPGVRGDHAGHATAGTADEGTAPRMRGRPTLY
jgi:hypothetical protein